MIRNVQQIAGSTKLLSCLKTKRPDVLFVRFVPSCFYSDTPDVTTGKGAVTKPGESQDVERFKATSSMPQKNVPFIKELFAGRYQKEMLIYPELNSLEDFEHINEIVAPVEKFFEEGIDSKQIDIDAKIPEETLRELGELGLFGQQIPEEYGGLGLNATEYARIAEVTALDGSIAVTLAAHQAIGLKGILIAGNEEQKTKYLPKLATGEHVAAFCLTEPTSGSDAASIQTRATLSEDGSTFHINGGKIWISNGGFADIFTVFAKTEVTDDKGVTKDKVTAFIVERAFGGITNGQPEDKLGIRGSNTCEVHFENTPVPVENVIGELGGGFKIAMNILNSGRFSMGSSGAGILKKLIGYTVEHATTRKQFNRNLSEFGLIQAKFAKMAVTTYAMESMAYLASQTIDSYHEPDVSVEAAMVKVFSSEGCWDSASECLQILGGLGYMKTYPYERYLRDARILMIFEGTNEILRMFIALSGVQYAGKELKELVQQLRNPFQNPKIVAKNLSKLLFQRKRRPKMVLHLEGEVHPRLHEQAVQLEKCVAEFETAVQELLKRYGKSIVEEQLDLKRLADIAIDIYAMTACIGRCSRSICLGLKNNDHEHVLTRYFCNAAFDRIEASFNDIYLTSTYNGDEDIKRIAETIIANKGYAATHPLAHNY